MHLAELLAGLPVENPPVENPSVTGICIDSRRVTTGDLFVALVGQHHDGRSFASQAIERGAVAVLAQGPEPMPLNVPWISVDDPRAVLGPLAARLYDHPDRRLVLAGVTGTNGKSTVAALLRGMLEAAGEPAGLIGTLGYRFQEHLFEGQRTTPEASDFFRILDAMQRAGAQAVAMEASSHALALGRLGGALFDVAVFTNLSHDHLDFHGDLASYFAAKKRLFEQLKKGGRAVVNLGDAHGRKLADELPGALTFGPKGDVTPGAVELDLDGIRGDFKTPRGKLTFSSPLLGRYNLENLLAAVAAAEALGLPHEAVAKGIAQCSSLPGRLESIRAGQAFPVLIDFAHTPAALEAALRSLRELSDLKILLVFGCGGDRDRDKRPMMGQLAGELADLPIATSDNPRSEDPFVILNAIEQGLKSANPIDYRVFPDRREAIRRAISLAVNEGEWVLLVAGKGHEQAQLVGDQRIPFSDREVIEEALREHGFGLLSGSREEMSLG